MRISLRLLASSVAVAVGSATLLAGCRHDPLKDLRKREAVVLFASGTPRSVRLEVRADCAHIPGVRPERVSHSHLRSTQLYDVRYRVDHASDQQLGRLYACLQKHHSVVGVKIPSNM